MIGSQERELFEPTPYAYPKGYFQAQAKFAQKIVQLGISPNIQSALLNYSLVYRHITGNNPKRSGPDKKWIEFVKQDKLDPENSGQLTSQIWDFYLRQPHSLYRPEKLLEYPNRFGSFIYKDKVDKLRSEQIIELHFLNQRRGQPKSDFSRSFVSERIEDLNEMVSSIQTKMAKDENYRPKRVILTSWMNALPGVQMALPPAFVATSTVIKPPQLDFRSNALWGQFLNNAGGVNSDRYFQFQNNLISLSNINQVGNVFPSPVLSYESPIDVFCRFYCSR